MKFLFLFLLALTGCSSMSSKPYVTEPAGSHKRAGILQNLFGVEGTTVEVPAPALKPEPKKRILENASEKENPLKVSKEKEQRKQMYEAQERAAVQPRATEDFSQALSAREKEEAMKKSNGTWALVCSISSTVKRSGATEGRCRYLSISGRRYHSAVSSAPPVGPTKPNTGLPLSATVKLVCLPGPWDTS